MVEVQTNAAISPNKPKWNEPRQKASKTMVDDAPAVPSRDLKPVSAPQPTSSGMYPDYRHGNNKHYR